jgi:hypothetical protein
VQDGQLGAPCLPDGTCADGLTCVADVCRVGEDTIDAPRDTPGMSPTDALCTDESEPNESVNTSANTNVDTSKNVTLTALAICPTTDIDVFELFITTAGENLEALVDYQNPSSGILMMVLNSGGNAIALSSTAGQPPKRLRAYTPNLPVGAYYVRVSANENDTYSLTFNVTGP